MELQEQITALEAEKKQYLTMIEHLNAEKLALDQMLVSSLKEALNAKKDNIINDQIIKNLNAKIDGLNVEKGELLAKIEELKNTLTQVASDAQY